MKKIFLLLAVFVSNIYAVQNIEVVGGGNLALTKVGVVKFGNEDTLSSSVSEVITNDLNVTGEFKATPYANLSQVESGTQYLITGEVLNSGDIKYRLSAIKTAKANTDMLSKEVSFTNPKLVRKVIHTISNDVYQKLTNTKGIFTSKIAYINKVGKLYNIIVCDYDGYNPVQVLSTTTPLSSLAWNNDGRQIAYVSYQSGKPVVYVQDLYGKDRYIAANFRGNNSSPVFMPDGNRLLVTLSKDDDDSHIYAIDNKKFHHASLATEVINFGPNIDTEASIGSDGTIVFSSDHDGNPQIFKSNINGGSKSRISVGLGEYNVTPRLSHDSSKVVFISKVSGSLQAYVLDFKTGASYPLNMNTNLDLSPSFAPNDKLVLYSSGNSLFLTNTQATAQTQLANVRENEIIDQRWSNSF